MSENQNFGFGKFIPGFDFLQDLAKGASQSLPQMPNLSSWVAPTLNLDELEKRIGELKAVHFWLDQNSKALGATIQALEVQKMTLATLKGMNFNMGEVANALQLKPAASPFGGAAKGRASPADVAAQPAEAAERPKPARRIEKDAKAAAAPAGGVVDPLQWWGALTQQFQQIATGAMKDVATQTAGDDAGGTAAAKAAARKAPAKAGNDKAASGAKRTGRKPSHP
ncbi:MAG: PhaM family polyhydroxyalkanoate granule multifunctional regulatory protein [Ramlibacter sp.]